ncbi:hypothetical protein ZWY2020_014021 [Hordeum vulgare]|nr:hypothetical protein ZWY2020_014021 [Hordeum vulgare]
MADRLIADAVDGWGVQDLEVVEASVDPSARAAVQLPPRPAQGRRQVAPTQPHAGQLHGTAEAAPLRRAHHAGPARHARFHASRPIRELVVDACSFMVIELRDLPMLARLACLTNTVELVFGSVPCLTHTNLSFSVEEDTLVLPPKRHHHDQLNHFLGTSPTMANLVIRFTGPKRWIDP